MSVMTEYCTHSLYTGVYTVDGSAANFRGARVGSGESASEVVNRSL